MLEAGASSSLSEKPSLQNLAIKKENLTHSFISNMGQVKDTVPIETVNRYIEQVNTLTTENENLKSLINDLEEEAENMENKFKEKELLTNFLILKLSSRIKNKFADNSGLQKFCKDL